MSLALLLAGGALNSCSEDTGAALGSDEASGYVALDMTLDAKPIGADLSRAASDRVTVANLQLTLTDNDRKTVTTHSVDEFADSKELPTGSYTLEASYGTLGEEGWGKIYCHGQQDFRVKLGKVTQVSLPVALSNSMVEVTYSDAFNKYLTDVTTTVVTEAGNSFDWKGDNTEELYISPGTFNVSVSFTKPNGLSGTAVVGPYKAEAKHQYVVNLDVDYSSAELLKLSIDDAVTEQEETIDISDENLPKLLAAPEVLLSDGYTLGQNIDLVEGSKLASSLVATVVARGRIASAKLTTVSADLVQDGFPKEIDLCNPADKEKIEAARAKGLELRGFSSTGGVFAFLDFTRLLPNIKYGENGSTETLFQLTVVDMQGEKTAEPLDLFKVSLSKFYMAIPASGQVTAEGKASINVECNAANPDFEVSVRNDHGAWVPVTVTPTPLSTVDGVTTYALALSGNAITSDREHEVKVSIAGRDLKVSDVVKVPSTAIMASKTNAFAKSSYFTVKLISEEAAKGASEVTFETSTNNGSTFSPATAALVEAPAKAAAGHTAVYKVTGLNPDTQYTIRADFDGENSLPVTFTTEAATPLQGGDMDNWDKEKKGDFQYLWYPGVDKNGPWETANNVTISTFGSGHSMTNHKGAAYVATSGTIPANGRSNYSNHYGGFIGTSQKEDGHTVGVDNLHNDLAYNGSKNAALIRTVGYGYGNSAGASTGNPASGFSTCEHVAAGELFYGPYDSNSGKYVGYEFECRPTSVSFQYKYVPYGSSGDYGECEVIVYDAAGEPITSKTSTIHAQNSYTLMSVALDYTPAAKKAAKIMIRFKSSAHPNLTNSSTWLYGPGNKNLTGGEYVGSELYIDDVTLNY